MASPISSVKLVPVESDIVFIIDRTGRDVLQFTGHGVVPTEINHRLSAREAPSSLTQLLAAPLTEQIESLLAMVEIRAVEFEFTGESVWAGQGEELNSQERQQRHFAIRLTPIDAARFMCVIRDITVVRPTTIVESLSVVDELSLHNHIIDSIPQGIVLTDARLSNNPIIYVNAGFEKLTGYERNESVGRNCRFLHGPETDPDTLQQIKLAMTTEQPIFTEVINYRKDGTAFWNGVSITPIYDEMGTLIYFVGIQTDVTELKRLEARYLQVQKMQAVGRLAGGIAHDFNNILTVIANYSEMVLSLVPESPQLHHKIEQIQKAGERAAYLTQQLLTFSHSQTAQLSRLDLNQCIQNLQNILNRLVGEQIVYHTELASNLYLIEGDQGQLEQTIINVVRNAYDAMPHGGELTIQTQNISLNRSDLQNQIYHDTTLLVGDYVRLTVHDTGVGMDEATLEHIFEPFFTTKVDDGRAGLGLSTTYGMVNQHNGFIDVESEEGIGTAIHLYFPRAITDDQSLGSQQSISPMLLESSPITDKSVTGGEMNIDVTTIANQEIDGPSNKATKEIILVVDDEQPILSLMAMILEEEDYVVLQATSAAEAFELVAGLESPVDLLVTDMVMPSVGGYELYDSLRAQQPDLKVVIVSGYYEVEIIGEPNVSPNIAFLAKPFTWQQLVETVQGML